MVLLQWIWIFFLSLLAQSCRGWISRSIGSYSSSQGILSFPWCLLPGNDNSCCSVNIIYENGRVQHSQRHRHRSVLAAAKKRLPEMSISAVDVDTRLSSRKVQRPSLTSYTNQTSIGGTFSISSTSDNTKTNTRSPTGQSINIPLSINQTTAAASPSPTSSTTPLSTRDVVDESSPSSLTRATEHVKAILQLYDESLAVQQSQQNSPPPPWGLLQNECVMYADIVLSALHDIIQSHLVQHEEQAQEKADSVSIDLVLEQVESLLTELAMRGDKHDSGIFLLIPPSKTLHALWRLHQCRFYDLCARKADQQNEISNEDFEKHISSCLTFLRQWHHWAAMPSSTINDRYFSPPPVSYLVQLIEDTQNCHQSLSDDFWDYYQVTVMAPFLSDSTSKRPRPPPRQLFTNLLFIVSNTATNTSISTHNFDRHMSILRHLIGLATAYSAHTSIESSDTTNDYWPTHDEFLTALRQAAAQGHAHHAAWILRGMMLADHYQANNDFSQTSIPSYDKSKNGITLSCSPEAMSLYYQALENSDKAVTSGYWTKLQTRHKSFTKRQP